MAGIAIGFRIGTAAAEAVVKKALADLAGSIPPGPLRDGFRKAAAVYLDSERKIYLRNARGGGDWAALAPSTVREKKRKGVDKGILRRSDRGVDSLVPGHADNVLTDLPRGERCGTAVPYLRHHLKRAGKRPARPPMRRKPDAATVAKMKAPIARGLALQAKKWTQVKVPKSPPAKVP
jgi:hypothetical protein